MHARVEIDLSECMYQLEFFFQRFEDDSIAGQGVLPLESG